MRTFFSAQFAATVVVTFAITIIMMLGEFVEGSFVGIVGGALAFAAVQLLLKAGLPMTLGACLAAIGFVVWSAPAATSMPLLSTVPRVALIGFLACAIAQVWNYFFQRSRLNST